AIRLDPTKDMWWLIPDHGGQAQEGQPRCAVQPRSGPLPSFPFFPLGGAPEPQGQVRVVGYGRASQTTERVVVAGTITKIATATDGTPVFEIESADRPERGISGSPVLNEQDRVVGIYTWNEPKSDVAG